MNDRLHPVLSKELSSLRSSQAQRRQWLRAAMEGRPARRRPVAGLVLAAILTLAVVTALAGAVGLLDFLHLNTLGSVRTVSPEWTQTLPGEVMLEVLEGASDGLSAHLLIRATAHAEDGLLVLADSPADTGLEEQYADRRALYLTPQEIETDGEPLWPDLQWRYESAQSVLLDISVDLRSREWMEQQITLTLPFITYILAPDGSNTENDAQAEVSVTLPLQSTAKEVFVGTDLPMAGEGFLIRSVTLTRTDMACYLDVEVEDSSDDLALLPLHGSFWFRVQDGQGNARPLLNGGDKLSLDGEEEHVHQIIRQTVQRFDAAEQITLTPYVWEMTDTSFAPITIPLERQPTS